ncbi:MAG TPA: ABC transporter substrate-binding protein [Thermopetrobacter sp.]|nr:ABC transporter substrate-binding protein [Thermopetrobacter sp.]
MLRKLVAAGALLAASATATLAEEVKIGFVTTLTTPAAVIGRDMLDAAKLAVKHMGGKMAGLDVKLIVEDDGFRPDIGRQKTLKLATRDKVRFLTGYIWSHVLMASRKPALDSGAFLISANAGPAPLAGKLCHENFFSTSWQNDQVPMALGEVLNRKGIKSLYVIVPNYTAGKNIMAGVLRTFRGEVKGRDLTKWGKDAQLDFSAELAKAAASGAEALFAFYPGKAGGAFLKQFNQSGLAKKMKLFTVFTVDAISLPKFSKGGIDVRGHRSTMFWSQDLDNPVNRRFVADFRKEYGRDPSFYAAQAYDAINLIRAGVEGAKGDLTNTAAIRAAMLKADFGSVRGAFRYGRNHFPVQDFYLREVVEGQNGKWTFKVVEKIYDDHQDPYAAQCALK